jgi:hypothetical protein
VGFCPTITNTKINIMKKTAFILFLTIMTISCKKGNDEKFPANPDWLNNKIAQMETTDYYIGTIVYAYEWNKEYYYLISPPLSSCYLCEFYNYDGVKYVWTSETSDDFQKNAKMIKIVWQRKLV